MAPPAIPKGTCTRSSWHACFPCLFQIGPKLLKFLPGQKVKDLRTWITAYSYWNQVLQPICTAVC
jgi:hypothetical protein